MRRDRTAYDLKKHAIKNSIFAADIEPSAVDIARLRLWLSLVIDEELNPEASIDMLEGHRNPLPLPNLECNIICGNSLIDEFEGVALLNQSDLLGIHRDGGQRNIASNAFEAVLPKLLKAQDDLFYCDDPTKKSQLIEQIAALKDRAIEPQLYAMSSESRGRYEKAKKTASPPFTLWQLEFARVFRDKGGFDVVIGNPPYRLCQPSNTENYYLEYYKKHFSVASYKIDLFHLFFEKGISLLKSKGVLSYITPNTYLTNKYIKPLRKYILDNCVIHKIVNHDKVFTAASVDTATIVMSKDHSDDNEIDIMQSANFSFTEVCKKSQNDWLNDKDYIFNINPAEIKKLNNCVPLGDICKSYFGIQAYDRKSSISEEKLSEHYIPVIDGADIHPYQYAEAHIYFNYIPENIKSGGDWGVYSKERVVVRQIGQIPVVGLCHSGILASNTLYSIYPKSDQYDLRYLFACLNSTYIQNYWRAKYSDNKALFPKIKGFQLKELPIPLADAKKQKEIGELVEQVIAAKQLEKCSTVDIEKKIDDIVNELYTQS